MQHLFIVTYGRSGSTLLARLLNEIDGYCIRGENGGVIRSLANSFRILGSTYDVAAQWDEGEHSPWFGMGRVDPLEWRFRLAREFVDVILQPPPDTRVTGFKEIRYTPEDMDDGLFTATIDFLAFGFENSRIVFNTRDAAEVAKSGWWATDFEPAHVHEIIATTDRRFREAHARIGSQRSFMIDYADYSKAAAGVWPLLDWLGEDVPRERLEAIAAERLMHLSERRSLPSTVRRWVASMVSRELEGPADRDLRLGNLAKSGRRTA